MLAAAQGQGFDAAADRAAAAAAAATAGRSGRGRGGKRKRYEAAEALGLIAAAAAAEEGSDEQARGVIGPLSAFAESRDAAAGCTSATVKLSQQVAGVEVQLASSSLHGPSLRVRASNVISARSCAYVPAYAYDNSSLAALQGPKIAAASWEARRTFLAATAAAWSNTCIVRCDCSDGAAEQQQQQEEQVVAERVALLAVGSKSGCVQIWRYNLPQQYSSSSSSSSSSSEGVEAAEQEASRLQYLGSLRVANGAYVTSLAWAVCLLQQQQQQQQGRVQHRQVLQLAAAAARCCLVLCAGGRLEMCCCWL
ncbi:hypothetical protein COO60DRAFT_849017 [Scenedesmus sp. NREL 46B-D3]|nr:hypothetical protein COO60DRAFT_849017 [Scenedesmus sp. NREL 46B-D3]